MDARPTAEDAQRALASLLSAALQQQASSPAHNAAQQSSPAPHGPAAHSSPAYTPGQASSVSGAPTPAAGAGSQAGLSSQMDTHELLRVLAARMASAGSVARQASGSDLGAQAERGAIVPDAPSASATLAAATPSSATQPPNSVYHPQPTRSGRMPQAPTHDSAADPSTVLFNDFFDFPSSDDEDDDPDFDPNAPAADFWGEMLAGDKGDGDLTENEGDWGGGPGERIGLTSEEFAKELALLTSSYDEDLPPPSTLGQGRTAPLATRTSPRRQRTIATAPAASSAGASSSSATAASRPRKRRRDSALSPVPEDMPPPPPVRANYSSPSPPSSSRSSSATIPTLASLGLAPHPASTLQQQAMLLRPSVSIHPVNVPAAAVPVPTLVQPVPTPTAAAPIPPAPSAVPDPSPEPDPAVEKRKKPNQARTKYTPEEAKQRRRDQEAARAVKRRAMLKEEKREREERVVQLEGENGELRERCAKLEARVRELEGVVEAFRAKERPHAVEESDESDGGEYQVESSEESSSEDEDDDDGAAIDAASYIRDVAAELDTLGEPVPVVPPAQGQAAHQPIVDLNALSSDGLSQLLAIVHAAAKSQGIPLEGATPRP
ncbi:uncharacterized protein JCM10292_007678 [Rhodotorula paludigena]|uniref:uncharacterized protein n=1 Tax=Rhodotorula paludigena TaxID=86838 RepID=UPI003170671E